MSNPPGINQPGYDPENPPPYSINPFPVTITPPGEGKSPFNEATGIGQTPPGPGPELLPDPSQGGGTNTAPVDDANQATITSQFMADHIKNLRLGGQAAPDPNTVKPEGVNYNPYGGKERFDETFDAGPARLAQAFRDSSDAQGQRSEALKSHYEKEIADSTQRLAAEKAQREQDNTEVQNHQAQLEHATTQYTNDLADQNKFWANPGNIISAIAFSLMPIGGGDPAMGAKLINAAIDRDMANRRNLADMHLGELRSNVGTYRKLAEDHRVGDALAESEAHRVAATEVQRIMSQFESPIAKAQGEAIIQDQMMRTQQARAHAYNQLYNSPQFINKRLMAGYAKGGESDYRPLDSTSGPTTRPTTAVQGTIAGTPSTANDKGRTVQLSASDMAKTADPKLGLRALAENRLPGGMDAADFIQASVASQAAVKAKVNYIPTDRNDPHFAAYENAKNDIVEASLKDLSSKAEPLAKIASSKNIVARLQTEMGIIERSVKDPNAFIGQLRNWTPDQFSAWYNTTMAKNEGEPNNPAQKRAKEVGEAARHFNQLSNMAKNAYIHEMSGGSVTSNEEGRMGQVIHGGADWHQLKGFVQARGGQINDEENSILGTLTPTAALIYRANQGIRPSTGVPTAGVPAPPFSSSHR